MTEEEAGYGKTFKNSTEFWFSLIGCGKPLEDFKQENDVIRFVFAIIVS